MLGINGSSIITFLSILFISIIFVCYLRQIWKLKKHCISIVSEAYNSAKSLDFLLETRFKSIVEEYQKTIEINYNDEKRSNIPASEYFSDFSICKLAGVNLKLIETGAGTLVGLGLLGTFLGLTIGIWNFDSTNSENIQSSIQGLLSGMGTAFLTSLFGMGYSLIYTWREKARRNDLAKVLANLNQKLDDEYYIDDVILASYNNKLNLNEVVLTITENYNRATDALFEKLRPMLEYSNAEGKNVVVANAIREILYNNEEQTKALKSFSSDLALEINDRLDETLSRQMQQRLIPLMESVDATTKSVVEHIDNMAMSVASPATDMIERVVTDLKVSLMGIMEDFRMALSKNATNELENLALTLGSATKAIGAFPENMANISEVLQLTITEVRNSIAEISNSSAAANSTAMKQMQEQIVFATNSIAGAIAEVKDVMSTITLTSEASSRDLIEKVTKSTSEMSSFMHTTMETLMGVMHTSMLSMTDDLTDKQSRLLELQENTTGEVKNVITDLSEAWKSSSKEIISQTECLLSKFDSSINYMSSTNNAVANTMDMFQQAQANITGTTSHLQSISMDMKSATELFRKGQADYAHSLDHIEEETSRKIKEIMSILEVAGNTTSEYVAKFEIIRSGLGQIFSQIQAGMNEYSNSVRISIQRYLDSYTQNLTATTDALASTIQQQNEMVEMLASAIKYKK